MYIAGHKVRKIYLLDLNLSVTTFTFTFFFYFYFYLTMILMHIIFTKMVNLSHFIGSCESYFIFNFVLHKITTMVIAYQEWNT